MENNRWVIYDGNLIRANQSVVPVESRGLMYGDGCFETLRVYKGAHFKLESHLDRLRAGAEFLGLKVPAGLEPSPIKKKLEKLLHKNRLKEEDSIVRVQLWREGGRGYHVQDIDESHYSILALPLPDMVSSVSLASVDLRRIPEKSLPSRFKLSNNINYITAARQAAEKGADDALMQTVDGYLSETTIANIFWISGSTVFTPSRECDLLPGITRSIIIQLVEEHSELEILEGKYSLKDIYEADAVWICNSVREVMAVSQIDDVAYNPDHHIVDQLKESFKKFIQSELAK